MHKRIVKEGKLLTIYYGGHHEVDFAYTKLAAGLDPIIQEQDVIQEAVENDLLVQDLLAPYREAFTAMYPAVAALIGRFNNKNTTGSFALHGEHVFLIHNALAVHMDKCTRKYRAVDTSFEFYTTCVLHDIGKVLEHSLSSRGCEVKNGRHAQLSILAIEMLGIELPNKYTHCIEYHHTPRKYTEDQIFYSCFKQADNLTSRVERINNA